jgi:hypothetical protein
VGDTLFWLREGDPCDWPTVICDCKFSEDYDHFQLGATDFLTAWMMNEITPKVFPKGAVTAPAFTQYSKG